MDRRLVEQSRHLLVLQLPEVAIELSDPEEIRSAVQAHRLVRLSPHAFERVGRSNRDGKHEPRRLAAPGGAQGGTHGRAGREAVVDDDRRPPADVHGRAILEVDAAAALDLIQSGRLHLLEIV